MGVTRNLPEVRAHQDRPGEIQGKHRLAGLALRDDKHVAVCGHYLVHPVDRLGRHCEVPQSRELNRLGPQCGRIRDLTEDLLGSEAIGLPVHGA